MKEVFMKKRTLLLCMILGLLALSFAACAKQGGEQKKEANATQAAEGSGNAEKKIAHICQALGDKSFSDSLESGMKTMREKRWD